MTEEDVKRIIREELYKHIKIDRYIFDKAVQVLDGRNIILGKTNGTQIGTEITQKLGFYGATPVNKPETVADPSGGATVDAAARTAVEEVIDRLQELGLIK